MGEMLGKLYVERSTSSPKRRPALEGLVANCVRRIASVSTSSNGWGGDEKGSPGQLAKFNPKIGYPNKWRDYSKLDIKNDDLAGNVMRAFLHENTIS